MASFFKTRFLPNSDGTDSATALTNVNTAFVHTYIGDDLTGDGTREFPYRSVYKANQKSGVTYIVFRGVVNESFSTSKGLIGDDLNQWFVTSNYSISATGYIINLTIDTISFQLGMTSNQTKFYNNLVSENTNLDFSWIFPAIPTNTLFTKRLTSLGHDHVSNYLKNCTVVEFKYNFGENNLSDYIKNNLFIKSLDLVVNYIPLFKYSIFCSSCIFKYGGIDLVQPAWTDDSKANVQLLRNAYLAAGMSSINVNLLFVKDSFGNETCRIIKESRNGGTSANIFNRYDGSGNVLDYSLNPDSANEALYASDTGAYVGCFKPSAPISAISGNTLHAPVNVLPDGSDDIAGTLLLNTADVISFATGSAQIWNRIKSANTIEIPNGIKFKGTNSMSTDGSPFGYYFGKHQILMDATPLNPGDALEPNTIYKVHNTTRTIYEAILYNGNQYLPDYFFKTSTTPLVFSLLNAGSGSVVKKVLAAPLESIEVIPYDDATTPSATFPKFSSPMFGNCLMLFHKIGVNIDKPVLFSEITTDKISYYNDWAVTNADAEFGTLELDTTNYYIKIPVLKYLRLEINGHFNADYDQ